MMAIHVLFITVCFLAYANGANDNFKGVAILFGSGTANYRLALSWATLASQGDFLGRDLLPCRRQPLLT